MGPRGSKGLQGSRATSHSQVLPSGGGHRPLPQGSQAELEFSSLSTALGWVECLAPP